MNISELTDRVRERREEFWRGLGEVRTATAPTGSADEPDLWPSGRSAYRRVVTEHAGILTTEGLSDPSGTQTPGAAPGLGLEVYVEGRELIEPGDPDGAWLVTALEEAAGALVGAGDSLAAARSEDPLLSLELSGHGAPEGWVADGRMGALLGVELPGRPARFDVDGTPVAALCLSPLRPEELAVVTSEGSAGRRRVAEALTAAGWYSYAEGVRPSVI